MLLELLLLIPLAILSLPVIIYVAEVLSACLLSVRKQFPANQTTARVAVLIPAHNESVGIEKTLASIQPQLKPGDAVIVVADNCTDDTAQVAQAAGATVLSRCNAQQRGKGFALAYGIDYLREDPPEVILFIDADCRITPGTVQALASAALEHNAPVQALNLCVPPVGSSLQHALSGLAFRFKNLIRMQGMTSLGGPCHLTGTGMGLPWALVEQVTWATGNVVEDMQLGIDYTLAGRTPRFVPQAQILSELPTSQAGMLQQRKRWEHGFLATALQTVPYLLGTAWEKRSWAVFLLACDMLVPPLALLTLFLCGAWCLTALTAACFGTWNTFTLATLLLLFFGTATLAGWYKFCRESVPLQTLLSIPQYLLAKIPLYCEFLYKRQQQWNRAQRTSS